MPARYVAMRDKFDKTMGHDAAQTKAAKIFNSTRKPGEPALGNADAYDKKHPPKHKAKGKKRYSMATNTFTSK